MRVMLATLTVALTGACSAHQTNQPAPPSSSQPASSSATTATSPSSTSAAPPSTSSTSPASTSPSAAGQCTDNDLTVTNGDVASANTLRHVFVFFKNTSTQPCTLVGYPGADLVTAAGGVLVHVQRRPANAAHRLTLGTGEQATAEVEAYAIDTTTGESCTRVGTLVVTPPDAFVARTLNVALPICSATVSSVD